MNIKERFWICANSVKSHWGIWSLALSMTIIMRLVWQPNYVIEWSRDLWEFCNHTSAYTGLASYWKLPFILQLILVSTLYYLQQTLPQKLFRISSPNLEPITAGSILCGGLVGFFHMSTHMLPTLLPALGCISLVFIWRTFYRTANFPACLLMTSMALTLSCFYIVMAMAFFHGLQWFYSLPFLIVSICFFAASLKVKTIENKGDKHSFWRSLGGTTIILLFLYPNFSYEDFLQQLSSVFSNS